MLLDRECLPTTIMDSEFNVVAAIFLDGRPPLRASERVWPYAVSAWDLEVNFRLKDVKTEAGKAVKLVVDRYTEFDIVWAGAMPDGYGGFTKGELLGADGYEGGNTMTILANGLYALPSKRDEEA